MSVLPLDFNSVSMEIYLWQKYYADTFALNLLTVTKLLYA